MRSLHTATRHQPLCKPPQLKKSPCSKEDPPQPKTNKIIEILQAAQCSQKKKEIWVSTWGRISQLTGKWREVWKILAIYKGPVGRLKIILSESRLVASDSLRPHRLYRSWHSPGQNTGVSSLSLLQGIFPRQGSNPGLLHWRWILYQLSHKGRRRILGITWI